MGAALLAVLSIFLIFISGGAMGTALLVWLGICLIFATVMFFFTIVEIISVDTLLAIYIILMPMATAIYIGVAIIIWALFG